MNYILKVLNIKEEFPMKKFISLLLAVLMAFSFVTVAFAEETTEAPAEEEIIDLGEYNWILDLPFWTVGPALKFAKIALKLVTVYLKVAKIFGLVEKDMDDYIIDVIKGLIENAQNADANTEVVTTAAQVA